MYLRATQSCRQNSEVNYVVRLLTFKSHSAQRKTPTDNRNTTFSYYHQSINPDNLLVRIFHAMRGDSAASCFYKILFDWTAY